MTRGRFHIVGLVLALSLLALTLPIAQAAQQAKVNVHITVLPVASVDFPPSGNGNGNSSGFVLHVPSKRCSVLGRYLGLLTGVWTGTWQKAWSFQQLAEDAYCKKWFPDWFWPVIRPVRIPFTVTGNATAVVSVMPSAFLKLPSKAYVGRATGPTGDLLGYQSVLHFPVPSASYAWLRGWELYEDWANWRSWGGLGTLPAWSRWAKLPWLNNTGTPPLSADMVARGMRAWGVIYIVARRDWTTNGKLAHPGDYRGSVSLTITAANR